MDTRWIWILICILGSLTFLQAGESSRRLARQVHSKQGSKLTSEIKANNRRLTRGTNLKNNGRLTREIYSESNGRVQRETNDHDPRMALGKLGLTGIGASFRSKRDQALKAEENALTATTHSVTAIETEKHKKSHKKRENEEVKDEGSETNSGNEKEPGPPEQKDSENADTKPEDSTQQSSSESTLSSALDPDRDSHLKKLMSESSDLAKELRMVFDILDKRELQLVDEMERLKIALTGAVTILKKSDQSSNQEGKSNRFRREFATAETPYKACVYIESSPETIASNYDGYAGHLSQADQLGAGQGYQGQSNELKYPPEPIVREFIPSKQFESDESKDSESSISDNGDHDDIEDANVNTYESAALEQEENSNDESLTSGEDIDLSKVYWLKLPSNASDDTIREKVRTVFSEVTGNGKDAIIIPVSRGFSSSEEVSRGFLKAVRVKPSALKSRYFKRLRRLSIREVH